MTRINCIPPEELCRQHLVAEYRELPRIYKLALAAWERGEDPAWHPDRYTLGQGHVRFFYSRMGYIAKRHRALVKEMKRRGYVVGYDGHNDKIMNRLPTSYKRSWTPDEEAMAINRARIAERLKRMKDV